jgi:hypothetical protein
MYKSYSNMYSSNFKIFSNNVNNLYSSKNFQHEEIDFESQIKSTFSSILKKNNKPTELTENISLFMTRVETLASTLSDAKDVKTEHSDKIFGQTKTKQPIKMKKIKIKLISNTSKSNIENRKTLYITPKVGTKSIEKISYSTLKPAKTINNLPHITKNIPDKKINMLKETQLKLNTVIKDCINKNTKLNQEVLDWGTEYNNLQQGKSKLEQLLNNSSEKFDYMNIFKSLGKVTIKPALEINNVEKKKNFIRIGPFPLEKVLKIDNLELYKFRKMIIQKYREEIEENPTSADEIQYRIDKEIRNRKHKVVEDILLKHSIKKRKLDSFLSKMGKS